MAGATQERKLLGVGSSAMLASPGCGWTVAVVDHAARDLLWSRLSEVECESRNVARPVDSLKFSRIRLTFLVTTKRTAYADLGLRIDEHRVVPTRPHVRNMLEQPIDNYDAVRICGGNRRQLRTTST